MGVAELLMVALWSLPLAPWAGDPDLGFADLPAPVTLGRVGAYPDGISGLSVPLMLCNRGDAPQPWSAAMDEEHPGVVLAMYRRSVDGDGVERLEQIGLSWVFHSYSPLGQGLCETCTGWSPAALEPGCSTSHGIASAGDRFWLGPRSEWDAHTGAWTCLGSWFDGQPVDCQRDEDGSGLDPVAHRLRVRDLDLQAVAEFIHEARVMAAGDSDPADNTVHRRCTPTWTGSSWSFSAPLANNPLVESPVALTWGDVQTEAGLEPDDGSVILSADVTDLGGGAWRYEYVLFNRSLDRQVEGLSLVAGTVGDVSFRDVDHDPGNDWVAAVEGDELGWTVAGAGLFEPGAGPLEFGVLYNFGFTSDRPPADGPVTLDLHQPGAGGDTLVLSSRVPDTGPWIDRGFAKAGSTGTPALTGNGPLVPGSANQMDLAGALPLATATLVVGFDLLTAPLYGGVLVPQPDLLVSGPLIDGLGSWSLPFTWPSGTPSGAGFTVQMWILDPGAAYGWAASNGLSGTSP